jgi:hypothetical protein
MTLDSVLLVVCAVAGQVHTMCAASSSMSASTGGCWDIQPCSVLAVSCIILCMCVIQSCSCPGDQAYYVQKSHGAARK